MWSAINYVVAATSYAYFYTRQLLRMASLLPIAMGVIWYHHSSIPYVKSND